MLRWKSSLKPADSGGGGGSYKDTVLADNPLFYYRLGEASGAADAYDEVATADNGTYHNTPTLGETGAISGDSNTAVKFEEANAEYADTVTLSSETSLLPCTIECFIKTDGASDSNAGIVFIRGSVPASGLNMYGSSTSVKKLGYHWNNGSATYGFSSGPTLADNTWYYVALVIESTKATFYIIDESGTLTTPVVNTTTHAAINASSNGWTIGRDAYGSNRSFQGTIDEVAIYDQAFSQSKVVAHAAAAGYTAPTYITLETSAENEGHTGYNSPYNISVNYPAVSTNDIMLAILSTERRTDFDGTPPTGWTKVIETDGDNAFNPTQAVYWKRATGSASATSETWSGIMNTAQYYYAWVGAYSGCVTSVSPIDASAGSYKGYSTSWSQSITTQTDNAMILAVAGSDSNARTFVWSDGTELVDKIYQSTASVSINEKIESTAGATTRAGTISGGQSGTITAVALKPASGGSTYAYGPEGFEGTGAPTGFTTTIVGAGTVDYNDTSDPGTGLQSLEVVTSGGDSYAELDLGAEYSNFTLIWQEKQSGGGSNRVWIGMSSSSGFSTNASAAIGNVDGWNWGFTQRGVDLTPTTTNVATGAWHYVKLEIDIASTSVTVSKSTSSDFSSPDTNTSSSFSFHSSFTGIRYLRFGGINRSHTILIDELSLEDNS